LLRRPARRAGALSKAHGDQKLRRNGGVIAHRNSFDLVAAATLWAFIGVRPGTVAAQAAE